MKYIIAVIAILLAYVAFSEARRSKNGALCHEKADVVYIAGKKYLAHREVGNSGRFCDIVSWKRSSSQDQRKTHLGNGQDRESGKKKSDDDVIAEAEKIASDDNSN